MKLFFSFCAKNSNKILSIFRDIFVVSKKSPLLIKMHCRLIKQVVSCLCECGVCQMLICSSENFLELEYPKPITRVLFCLYSLNSKKKKRIHTTKNFLYCPTI